ncbi:MAG: oligosaccharide flippase family protein [Candidatus Parvarchaeota archaeon]|nr:oligosaccharide flippase family protein [Candidatus Parvarchaeum tengchongense]
MEEVQGGNPSEIEELGISTAKSSGMFVSGKVVGAVLSLAMLIFLARVLGPQYFGFYTLVISFSMFLGLGGNFGIATALRKLLPEDKDKAKQGEAIGTGYAITALVSAAIAIAGILLSGIISQYAYHNSAITMPMEIASITVLLSVLVNMGISAVLAIGRSRRSTNVVITYSSLEFVFTVLLVELGYGVLGAMLGIAAGLLIGAMLAFYYIASEVGLSALKATKAMARKLTRFSIPLVVSNVAQVGIVNFGILLLGVFVAANIVGNFGTAFKLGRFVELLLTSSTFVLLPAFSRAIGSEGMSKRMSSIYNNSIYYAALILAPVIAYLSATSIPLIRLLFSKAYPIAPMYFSFIAIGTAIGLLGSYAGTLIIGYGDTRKFMKYQIIGVVVELALLLALTPFIGAFGVLIAMFAVAPVLLDILYSIALKGQFSLSLDYSKALKAAIAALIPGLLILGIGYMLHFRLLIILVNFIVIAALYPPILAYIGGISRHNLDFIARVGRGHSALGRLIGMAVAYTGIFVKE